MNSQIKILLDQYLLLSEKSNNNGSFTILGFDRKNSVPVYIKKLPLNKFSKEIKEISQERKFSKSIFSHKNIVTIIIDEYESSANYYYIEEYCYLDNLSCLMSIFYQEYNMLFSQKIIQFLVKQILTGLDYLHEKNINHCILTIENIMVTYENYEKLFKSKSKIDDIYILKSKYFLNKIRRYKYKRKNIEFNKFYRK